MKAEELKTKLDGAATKEDLKVITDANEANKTTLASIQASLAKLTTPKEQVKEPTEADDPTVAVLTDPSKFVSDQTKDIRDRQYQTQADLEEMRARAKYTNHFSQFGDDLMATAKKAYTIQQRSQPTFWDFHVQNYVGAKVLSGEIKPGNYPSLLGTSAHGPKSGSADDPNHGFSDDMASWFKERGLPLDKAAKLRDLTIRDGEPLTLAKYTGKQAS